MLLYPSVPSANCRTIFIQCLHILLFPFSVLICFTLFQILLLRIGIALRWNFCFFCSFLTIAVGWAPFSIFRSLGTMACTKLFRSLPISHLQFPVKWKFILRKMSKQLIFLTGSLVFVSVHACCKSLFSVGKISNVWSMSTSQKCLSKMFVFVGPLRTWLLYMGKFWNQKKLAKNHAYICAYTCL